MRRLPYGILLASIAASVASPAAAAPPQRGDPEGQLVKDMLRDAIAAERAGKCKDALGILRQAAAVRETGEVLLHMGECQAQTGALTEALKTWENAEDVARNERDRATEQALVQKLEQLRARIPTVLLRLPKDVPSLTVKIDDQPQPADRVSTPILVNPGEHTLVVTAPGRQAFTRRFPLVERDGTVINVALPPIGAPPAPVEAAPETAAAAQPLVPIGTWVAGGAAIVLAGAGVASFVAAGSAAADGRAQCATQPKCDPASIRQVHELDA
ncbi:MAG TPA: hypothetical protein VHB21_15535, partial [Minicystis sp.]|nr:hypothetical protein [Minicystis sp.]